MPDSITNHNHDDRYYLKVPTLTPLLEDTFSRTGPLAGSVSDSGATWQSTYEAWQTNGGAATASALALASVPLTGNNYQATFDLDVVTAGNTSRSLSLVMGGFNDLWVTVSLNPSGGCQVAAQKRFAWSSSVVIVPTFVVLVPNTPTPQRLEVTITIHEGEVTIEADGITRTAEITATEQEMIDPTIGLVANNNITGISINRIQAFGVGVSADDLAPADHRHVITDVDGLQEALDAIDADVTGALGIHSANAHGADSTASWQVNRDAFQAACDSAALAGGGRVVATPGTYTVAGIVQDSRVELYLPGVTLKHPGTGMTSTISARQRETTGAVSAGSRTLTVASTAGIEPGVMVAVRAAGGLLDTQYTSLTAAIDATQTTGITLTDPYGYLSAGWMVVGSELITHTGISNGVLTGVVRGSLGTTAAAHAAAARIGLARRLYGEVISVQGTTVTLDVPAAQGVANAAVTVGAMAPKITGARFDGSLPRPSMTFGAYPVSWGLVSHGTVTEHTVVNAESAMMLTRGSRYCRVQGVRAHDCGGPEGARGAALWLYEGCDRNVFRELTITGRTWVGVYLDDRTSTADEWAAPNSDNLIEDFVIAPVRPVGYPGAIDITGSVRNRVRSGSIIDTSVGVKIDDGAGQVHTSDGKVPDTGSNQVSGISMRKVDNPWLVKTSGNILHTITYSESLANGSNTSNSLVYAVTRTVGGPPVM